MTHSRPLRWSGDDDRYVGPFTIHKGHKREFGIVLRFSDGDEHTENYCRMHFNRWTVLFRIPQLVKPHREWKDTSHIPNCSGGYWALYRREYGITLQRREAFWKWGVQRECWPNGGSGCWFYPWSERTKIAWTAIHPDGTHMDRDDAGCDVAFQVRDFDGETVEAALRFTQLKFRVGKGLWHWLRFGKIEVHHSVEIEFSAETGRRKGSWKGGTLGVSMPRDPADSHVQVMRKYCEAHDMTLISAREVQP